MGRKNIPVFFIVLLLIMISHGLKAGGVADFAVGSKSKITLNPAGAALVDRILFNFTVFSYRGGNRLSPFNNQFRDDDYTTYLQTGHPHSGHVDYETVDYIEFKDGTTEGLHVDLAYPASYFTVGCSLDHRAEKYEDGHYVGITGTEYDGYGGESKAEHNQDTLSYFFAIPLQHFSIGVRQNQKETKYKFTDLSDFSFSPYEGYWGSSTWEIYQDGAIEGKAEHTFYDYGLLWHAIKDEPVVDVSLFYRPPSIAMFRFETLKINGDRNHDTDYSMEDFEFIEPGINLMGISLANRTGFLLSQFVIEAGNYTSVKESLDYQIKESRSERDRAFDIMGYLIRVAYHPNIDLAYGYKSHEIAGSLTEVTSIGLKFPFPLYKELILTMGTSETKVSDDADEVVAKKRSYSFSFEMKLGKPISKKALRLAPKTKTLPPDFP